MDTFKKSFFWLHIKKSAGSTVRKILHPHYLETDRSKKPINFLQAKEEEYNDVLNNYRVVLGDYQFKRCLFAKEVLYQEKWDNFFSFAFSREPIDRCLSMFYYLYYIDRSSFASLLRNTYRGYKYANKIGLSKSFSFDVFLDLIDATNNSDSNYSPVGLHFATHVASMWEDVTDKNENMIISEMYRLEDLKKGLDRVASICGFNLNHQGNLILNKSVKKKQLNPTPLQIKKIENLYAKDFEIYESKCYQF